MPQRFEGRVAIVTGATQGVGNALVHRLVDEGLVGAVVTGRSLARGAALERELQSKGCNTVFVQADLADVHGPADVLAIAAERFGVVHHLANCAGQSDRGGVWDTTPELFDLLMAVNVRAPFLLIQGVARLAVDAKVPASVVNVGSMIQGGGPDFLTPYSISKGALATMTRNLAFSLMRHRIRVNTVSPGWMDTPGEDAIQRRYHGATDGWLEEAEAIQPFGRLIKASEIAATLGFVLSDDAGLMTGAIIDYGQSIVGGGIAPAPPTLDLAW